jgi:hypothetical protein
VKFQFNDGGRIAAGYKGSAGDCVVRSVAIATALPYQAVGSRTNGQTEAGNKQRTNRCSQIHNQVGDGIAWLEVDSDDANRVRLHGSLAGG